MKKIIASISMIFILLLTLSSCGDDSNQDVNLYSISEYILVGTCVDDSSTFAFTNYMIGDFDQYFKREKKNTSNSFKKDNSVLYSPDRFYFGSQRNPQTALVSYQNFSLLVVSELGTKSDAKTVEFEVDSDVIINGNSYTKGKEYSIDVEGYKDYFVLDITLKNSVIITFKKVIDEDNNVYSTSKYYAIELLDSCNLISFNDSYDELIINNLPNIKVTSIKIKNDVLDNLTEDENETIKESYSLSTYDYVSMRYEFSYGETYVEGRREYYVSDESLSQSGLFGGIIIHEY